MLGAPRCLSSWSRQHEQKWTNLLKCFYEILWNILSGKNRRPLSAVIKTPCDVKVGEEGKFVIKDGLFFMRIKFAG